MPRVYSASPSNGAIRQGEILSGLTEQRAVGPASNEDEAAPIDFVRHPFAVVLTQDCDLDSDFNTRREPGTNPLHKLLPNILFAEVFLARELRGQHNHLTSNLWRRVRKNEEQRYHYLPRVEPKDDALGEGSADDLTIDFKQVFTLVLKPYTLASALQRTAVAV